MAKLSSLFHLPPRKLDAPPKMPVYPIDHDRVNQKSFEDELDQRLYTLGEHFGLANGVKSSEDERLILQDERLHLQVYRTSNSFWYYDRALAAPDSRKFADVLMNEKKARFAADAWLEEQGLTEQIRYHGVGFTQVTHLAAEGEDFEQYNTEVLVNYGFHLDKLPVFGPGAQIKIAFTGPDKSEVAYFWRHAQPAEPELQPIISPEQALLRVGRDRRFARLKPKIVPVAVRFHTIQLGYYALPAHLPQRLFEPVYRITGTVENSEQKNEFTLHVLALAEADNNRPSELMQYSEETGVF